MGWRAAELMSSDPSPEMSALVAVLTYQRNEALRLLVRELVRQADAAPGDVAVLVVDNNPDGSAEEVVAESHADQVGYAWEQTPGIAAGRNRALTTALGAGVDAVIFIDDDEVPDPQWLLHMLSTASTHDCSAVVGPVLRTYEIEPDPVQHAARVFDRVRHPTGTSMPAAGTGNLLLKLPPVRELNLRFDADFSESGGSDTMFTRQLVQGGHRIVWCDEAVVTESVPAKRLTRQWVYQRSVRSGITWARTSVALADTRRGRLSARLAMSGKGVVRLAGGAARYGYGKAAGEPEQQGMGLRTFARGMGMVRGSYGYVYHEYRRPALTES